MEICRTCYSMKQQYPAIVDANRARVAEGLRVIEEYVRFLTPEAAIVERLVAMRKAVRMIDTDSTVAQLQARDTKKDLRAHDRPPVRSTARDLLLANFKRAQEGLSVLEEYTGNARYNRLRYDLYALEKDVVLRVLRKRIRRGIYLISDRVAVLEQGLRWGVVMIQLRDKTSSKTVIMKKAERSGQRDVRMSRSLSTTISTLQWRSMPMVFTPGRMTFRWSACAQSSGRIKY